MVVFFGGKATRGPRHGAGLREVGRSMKILAATVIALISMAILLQPNQAGEKPKFTIPQVMKTAHSGDESLVGKVIEGTASAEEKKELVELYKALAANKPPKGDAKSWKERTEALVKASEAAAKGEEAAAKSLLKLSNCNACHTIHRPKKE